MTDDYDFDDDYFDDDWYPPTLCADCLIAVQPEHTPQGSQDWHQYMVHDAVWRAAGMKPAGGHLCVGCLEARLARTLVATDLKPGIPINEPGRYDDHPRLAALKLAVCGKGGAA